MNFSLLVETARQFGPVEIKYQWKHHMTVQQCDCSSSSVALSTVRLSVLTVLKGIVPIRCCQSGYCSFSHFPGISVNFLSMPKQWLLIWLWCNKSSARYNMSQRLCNLLVMKFGFFIFASFVKMERANRIFTTFSTDSGDGCFCGHNGNSLLMSSKRFFSFFQLSS